MRSDHTGTSGAVAAGCEVAPATTVVYVSGTGRSGSTLLGNAVGSLPGALSVGEVKLGFKRGLAEGGTCGCRAPVRECPVWKPALEATFGAVPSASEAMALDARLAAAVRTRTVPWWVAGRESAAVDDLVDVLGRLVSNLATASGASVIVDSSKLPSYGALLGRSPLLDVRVLHLTRDPRAVAWSWQRSTASQQVSGFEEEMERFSPTKAGLMWLESSSSTAALARRAGRPAHLVRYEDLVASPARTLADIAAYVGVEPDLAFVTDDGLDLRISHAVAGNPNRVRSGPLTLRRDDEWVSHMPARQRRLVSTLTAPRRHAHGY